MNIKYPLKHISFLLVFFFLVSSSCRKKEEEVLVKDDKKKVLLLQVDYDDYAFNCGKEFSYFVNTAVGSSVPVDSSIIVNGLTTRISMLYGDLKDTIFDGTQVVNGTGVKNYPDQMDNQIFYFRADNALPNPDPATYQMLYYDLGSQPVPYDSIWKDISDLEVVRDYRSRNPGSRIGLFLFRPSDVAATADWKWYVILRD